MGGQVQMSGQRASPRMDNIDFLRAVAILLVVGLHYTSRFPAEFYRADEMPIRIWMGGVGVDLFFVVSAFCISMTLVSSKALEVFWAKRLARIQPAYIVGITLTFLTVSTFPIAGREVSWWVPITNALWFNVYTPWPLVDGAYWSLAVELKFYFWIGLFYYLLPRRSLSSVWAAFCVVGALMSAAHDQFGVVGHGMARVADEALISSFSPEFLIGLCAYERKSLSGWKLTGLLTLAAVLMIPVPRLAGAHLETIAALAFGFVVLQFPNIRVPRPIRNIGLISYSLYVIHQNIGYVVIRELEPFVPSIAIRLIIAFCFVVVLATLLFNFVETRFQKRLAKMLSAGFERLFGVLRLRPRRPQGGGVSEDRIW